MRLPGLARSAAAAVLCGLALRWGAALVTESHPIFPAHYYADATEIHRLALETGRSWNENGFLPVMNTSNRLYVSWVYALYHGLGPSPLWPKLVNGALSVAAAWAWYRVAALVAGQGPALLVLWLLALWPTGVFIGSQNTRDALVLAASAAAVYACAAAWSGPPGGRRPARLAALGFCAMILTGLNRPYIMTCLAVSVLASGAAAFAALRRPGEGGRRYLAAGAVAALAFAAFQPVARFLFNRVLAIDSAYMSNKANTAIPLVPETARPERPQEAVRPLSPRAITEFRRIRQSQDQLCAERFYSRKIHTQIFPDAEFGSWLDVASFLPKGAFYAMFMPLPGLYPVLGQGPGRLAAALENVLLLALFLAAMAGLPRLRAAPAGWLLLCFFSLAALGYSLFELDLGSAARHRLQYFPCLLPFAAAWLSGRRGEPAAGAAPAADGAAARDGAVPARLRVMQVVECGGPGGTGNQVAALVRGLSKDPRFEVSLAYAVRPGSTPWEYEALAGGAARYHHVPRMVREISPLDDIAAWLALYRLLMRERPDVVHAHSSKAGFLARLAALAAGVPKVFYSPRGYSFLQTDRAPLSRALYRALESSVSRIGRIAAVSESEASLARALAGSGDVAVLRDAYLGGTLSDGRRAPSGVERGRAVVAALGRMSVPRRPEAFVRLAGRLAAARGGVSCVWIGGGELEPAVRELARGAGLSGRLELTGWLGHEEAMSRLAASDILVHYSLWEGLPNAVIEGMALGLPVVASDIPGNRDLVRPGENGFLAKDEDELLELALRLADDPSLRARLGGAGRDLIRREYLPERLVAEAASLYLSEGSSRDK